MLANLSSQALNATIKMFFGYFSFRRCPAGSLRAGNVDVCFYLHIYFFTPLSVYVQNQTNISPRNGQFFDDFSFIFKFCVKKSAVSNLWVIWEDRGTLIHNRNFGTFFLKILHTWLDEIWEVFFFLAKCYYLLTPRKFGWNSNPASTGFGLG